VAVSVRALMGSEVQGKSPETVAARRAAPSNDESYDSLSNSAPCSAAQSFLDAFIAEETSACLESATIPN
jgi:hypothetical protein